MDSEHSTVLRKQRVCSECGVPVRPGDGGIRAYGRLFCSEECADEREIYNSDRRAL